MAEPELPGVATTRAVVLAATAILALYDVYAIRRWGSAGSISWCVHAACRDHPIVAFLAGCLIGHLFLPLVVRR